ncbi:MAG: mannitol-1-phosphate 5-dehydrogenase [Bifidobacteriaceae bacterium]|jgi:mannitol-1-phosphate 5-dehydrogenase|nr:mannitol-1-phosphate 5-dehydrogenase [Bifidobacteriaceae bacterium]
MKAVHFGAGNIGRGFIGEILHNNGYQIIFVDINDEIIDQLKLRGQYTIEIADKNGKKIQIDNVTGLNNRTQADLVIESIAQCDIITTAIGPNILPFIAELIAKGLQKRFANSNNIPLDIIACENMLGGSEFLKSHIEKYVLNNLENIGFPNAAVDRIVPLQKHIDPLYVSVEPFSEWVVDNGARKSLDINLQGVHYVSNLQPFIERKLFSVNTGHAAVSYLGQSLGFKTIDKAMANEQVFSKLKAVLNETSQLLIKKWQFDEVEHQAYLKKIMQRFENHYISDNISRVARTPIRKLGFHERFIRPIRECKQFGLPYNNLLDIVAIVFKYYDSADEESVKLKEMLKNKDIIEVIQEVTNLKDLKLVEQIKQRLN